MMHFHLLAMIDLNLLREDFAAVKAAVSRKKFSVDFDAILALDEQRREIVREAESRRAQQKAASAAIAKLPKGSPEFLENVAGMKQLAADVKEWEAKAAAIDAQWRDAMLTIPNLPDPAVPDGSTEADNRVVRSWGDPAAVSAHARAHFDIPGFEAAIDFNRGAKVSGAGFPFYIGDTARLLRTLIAFFLDEAARAGYVEMASPLMVNAASATATGQLPDKEGQMYQVPYDELYLIPTAEVPVTNFFRDETFAEQDLPVRRAAHTPCFRREAGSWGRHVRGLNRLHQFDKVELVEWVHPDCSMDALEALRAHAESLLEKLGLPFRTLLMCAGDIGFPHAKQYDLEVWAGGQKRWLEVSSCSNFTDFQARRAGIRYRLADGGKGGYVHTLNGSGLALPRVLAALLENGLSADGRVALPACLHAGFGADSLRLAAD